MAKDKNVDYSKLTLGNKIPLKKTEEVVVEPKMVVKAKQATPPKKTIKPVEEAVKVIHAAPPKTIKPMITDERTLRVTLDIPLSLHAQIRTKTFQEGISMKEYFLEMAKRDMGIS
jgi:hypothetical protein